MRVIEKKQIKVKSNIILEKIKTTLRRSKGKESTNINKDSRTLYEEDL